jgi:hypothetical protein
MDTQSLRNILCTFFDWHPARITTFAELILAVVKARTLRLKELALHVTSKTDRLNPTQTSIVKIERFLFWQEIDMQIAAAPAKKKFFGIILERVGLFLGLNYEFEALVNFWVLSFFESVFVSFFAHFSSAGYLSFL